MCRRLVFPIFPDQNLKLRSLHTKCKCIIVLSLGIMGICTCKYVPEMLKFVHTCVLHVLSMWCAKYM